MLASFFSRVQIPVFPATRSAFTPNGATARINTSSTCRRTPMTQNIPSSFQIDSQDHINSRITHLAISSYFEMNGI
jgi:hypothetical protein